MNQNIVIRAILRLCEKSFVPWWRECPHECHTLKMPHFLWKGLVPPTCPLRRGKRETRPTSVRISFHTAAFSPHRAGGTPELLFMTV